MVSFCVSIWISRVNIYVMKESPLLPSLGTSLPWLSPLAPCYLVSWPALDMVSSSVLWVSPGMRAARSLLHPGAGMNISRMRICACLASDVHVLIKVGLPTSHLLGCLVNRSVCTFN